MLILGFMGLLSTSIFADDSIKVTVGTQSYHCTLGSELDCKAVNEIERKTVLLKKNGGTVGAEDKERGLSADVATSLNGGNVIYDVTICSSQSCSVSTVTSDSIGSIDQVISGQYNITQKSFDVIGFFVSTHSTLANFQAKILNGMKKIKL